MYQVLDAVDAKVEWTTYDGWGVYFPDGYFRFNVGPADQPGENQEATLLSAPIMQYSVSATQTACAPLYIPNRILIPPCRRFRGCSQEVWRARRWARRVAARAGNHQAPRPSMHHLPPHGVAR
jgi:hypothetical protein